MNTREINKINDDNYEHNLKLHYEAQRKDLDIVLSSSMPLQMNNIKTIMWINLLFIGLSLHLMKEFTFSIYYGLFYISSLLAIGLTAYAMTVRQIRYYGSIDDKSFMRKIPEISEAKQLALLYMLDSALTATRENKKTLESRSFWMNISKWLTIFALVSFVSVFSYTNSKKGDNEIMAKKDAEKYVAPPQPIKESSVETISPTRTVKPKPTIVKEKK